MAVLVGTDEIPQGGAVPSDGLGYVSADCLGGSEVNESVGVEAAREIGGGVRGIGKSEGRFPEGFVRMAVWHAVEIKREVARAIRAATGKTGGIENKRRLFDPGGGVGEGGGAKSEITVLIRGGRSGGTTFLNPDAVFRAKAGTGRILPRVRIS